MADSVQPQPECAQRSVCARLAGLADYLITCIAVDSLPQSSLLQQQHQGTAPSQAGCRCCSSACWRLGCATQQHWRMRHVTPAPAVCAYLHVHDLTGSARGFGVFWNQRPLLFGALYRRLPAYAVQRTMQEQNVCVQCGASRGQHAPPRRWVCRSAGSCLLPIGEACAHGGGAAAYCMGGVKSELLPIINDTVAFSSWWCHHVPTWRLRQPVALSA